MDRYFPRITAGNLQKLVESWDQKASDRTGFYGEIKLIQRAFWHSRGFKGIHRNLKKDPMPLNILLVL